MGNSNKKSVENGDDPKLKGTTAIAVLKPVGKSKKLLCLHGWRTSGEILLRQTTALRYHTEIEVVVIDAPTVAKGPPAEGIAEFYSEYSYFEWYDGLREGVPVDMNTVNSSLEFLKLHLEKYGPYDGILGFSQGGSVATMLAQMQQKLDVNWFKFIVLIGAVQPPENCFDKEMTLRIPSLHIIGNSDPYESFCVNLLQQYSADSKTLLRHEEGHNIPSIRTGLYPEIKTWLDNR